MNVRNFLQEVTEVDDIEQVREKKSFFPHVSFPVNLLFADRADPRLLREELVRLPPPPLPRGRLHRRPGGVLLQVHLVAQLHLHVPSGGKGVVLPPAADIVVVVVVVAAAASAATASSTAAFAVVAAVVARISAAAVFVAALLLIMLLNCCYYVVLLITLLL